MRKAILYVSALDENGKLCFAFNEDKSLKKKYFCPNCNVPMVLKKSENIRRPHFAHKTNEEHDCNPETVLHQTFKIKLCEILKEHLQNSTAFNFVWECQYCKEKHSGDLLKKVGNVYLEKDLGECRPDILLTDKNDKPFVAIEIVVTHHPEEKTIQYYKNSNIFLYKIVLQSDEDLKDIEGKAKNPVAFDLCTRPKCNKHNLYKRKREFFIQAVKCPKCSYEMAISYGIENGRIIYPKEYRDEEIEYAKNKSVVLKRNYSNEMKKIFFSNTCPHCNIMYEDNYITNKWQELTTKDRKIFFYCNTCEKENQSKEDIKCEKCDNPLITRTINVFKTKCHTCNSPIIIAEGEDNTLLGYYHTLRKPKHFKTEQIAFANRNGANIQQVRSSLFPNSLYTNVCPKCGDMGNRIAVCEDCNLIASQDFNFCQFCEPQKEIPIEESEEKCNKCGGTKTKRIIIVVETYCYKCKGTMKVAFVKEPNGLSFSFNSRHISFAKRYGVVFTETGKFPMACPHCSAPISETYVNKYASCKEIAHETSIYCRNCYRQKKQEQTFDNDIDNAFSNSKTIAHELTPRVPITEMTPLPNLENIKLEDLAIPQDDKHPHKKAK